MLDALVMLMLFVVWFGMGWMVRDSQAEIEWNRERKIEAFRRALDEVGDD